MRPERVRRNIFASYLSSVCRMVSNVNVIIKRGITMKLHYLGGLLFLICSITWATENTVREMVVYKDPNCGCCSKWASHLRDNGFTVTEVAVDDISLYKSKYNVPSNMSSCHTGVIQGYVIEGHVPAADVVRLLQERPDITGLTVPGMPLGSPGMEVDGRSQAYDVMSLNRDGTASKYNSYPEKQQ